MSSEARLMASNRGASYTPAPKERRQLLHLRQALQSKTTRVLMLLMGVLLVVALLLSQRQALLTYIDHEVNKISVHGQLKRLSVTEIEGKFAQLFGSSFLLADLTQIKVAAESLPWVYRATVSRVWPGEISLTIEEQVPVVYWNKASYLNAAGEVFSPEPITRDEGFVQLLGAEQSQQSVRVEMLSTLGNLQRLLQPHELSIKQLELKPRGVWEATLANGVVIALGKLPFEAKIARLVSVLSDPSGIVMDNIERVDTRYPNGVAIKWKEIVIAAGPSS